MRGQMLSWKDKEPGKRTEQPRRREKWHVLLSGPRAGQQGKTRGGSVGVPCVSTPRLQPCGYF